MANRSGHSSELCRHAALVVPCRLSASLTFFSSQVTLHYFHRQWTSSPSQIGDVVLIPSTGSFQGMSGYVATLITRRDIVVIGKEVFARIGLAAYPKQGLVHQVFFAAGDGEGGNHVPEIIQLMQEDARLLSPSGSLTSVQRSNTVQTRATT